MKVIDIISACEYIGCDVYDQLGIKYYITDDNANDVYNLEVEHIDAYDSIVRISTFENLDSLCNNDWEWVRDENLRVLVQCALDKIRKELDRLYWNKNQREMDSPFDNSCSEDYKNNYFVVRSYKWNFDDEDYEDLPNFESPHLRVKWYKHSNRGVEVFMLKNFVSADTVMTELTNCLKALKEDFGENED